MLMRNCAVWLSVIGFCACTSTAWAAPKKKSKKSKHDKTEQAAEPAPVEPEKVEDVDSLMNQSTKKKAKAAPAAAAQPEPEPEAEVGEPDAWERPPAEEEKPKKRRSTGVAAAPVEKSGDDRHWNVGIFAGYGAALGGSLTALNPYSLGFGLQADYELDSHLVLGVGGEYFIGGSDTAPNSQGVSESRYANYILAHANVGYNFWFGTHMFLRPSLWVGAAIAIVPPRIPHLSGSEIGFMLAPGISYHYLLGDNGWYVGGDLRFVIPFGQYSNQAFTILAMFGRRF